MILNAIHNAFKKAEERNWKSIYIAVDIHDTIVESNYKINDIHLKVNQLKAQR